MEEIAKINQSFLEKPFSDKFIDLVNFLFNVIYEDKQNADLYIEVSDLMIKYSDHCSDSSILEVIEKLFNKMINVFYNEDCDSVFYEEVYGMLGDIINKHPLVLDLILSKFNGNHAFERLITDGIDKYDERVSRNSVFLCGIVFKYLK